MDDLIVPIILMFVVAIVVLAVVLPIVALVVSIRSRTKLNRFLANPGAGGGVTQLPDQDGQLRAAVGRLEARVGQLESIVGSAWQPRTESQAPPTIEPAAEPQPPTPEPEAATPPPAPIPITPEAPPPAQPSPQPAGLSVQQLESIIGRRWVGWAAIALILFAAAFFLKYAFDNRWIGELGRVSIGIAAGLTLTILGFRYHLRGWRVFSQILSAGGVVLLYLSAYAAFGYYHLVPQKVAFVFLVIIVAEAAGLALLYNAPAIAVMALIGGFLTPLLLHTDQDQYVSLFGYIIVLDLGALALLKRWRGLSAVAFVGTHLLFWIWYADRYHPQKLGAVMVFHIIVFLMFLIAHVVRQFLRPQHITLEHLSLILSNPFVFFATAYHILDPYYHDWMGAFAIGMAVLYAATAKLILDRPGSGRNEVLALIGVALTFVTIAIPIQLTSNWITIAWAVEALAMLWAGIETKTKRLQVVAWLLFVLAIGKLIFFDTPYGTRPPFTPVFNRYFLSSLAVIACVFAAAWLYERTSEEKAPFVAQLKLVAGLMGVVLLWIVMSIETQTYFTSRVVSLTLLEDVTQERWLGQMALSVLWATYAAVLATIGFMRRSAGLRWAALVLFAVTIIKAMLVDIAYLQQIYRIIVFFVLGILLLLVAWGYHKVSHNVR